MKKNKIKIIGGSLVIVAIVSLLPSTLKAQSNPVQLDSLIHEMISKHPDIEKARQALVESDEQMAIIHSSLNPKVDGRASYSYIKPLSQFDLAGLGKADITVANNYNMEIDYNQTFFDFGRTRSREEMEKERQKVIHYSIDQLRQQLSVRLIQTYYQVVYVQNALKINEEEMKILQEHLGTVQKKLDAGTSTRYEVLSTQVRISRLKSKRVDLRAMHNKALSVMTSLVGRPFSKADQFSDKLPRLVIPLQMDTLLQKAYRDRDELKIALQQEHLANLKVETIKNEMNPSVQALASVSGRNGYEPNLKEIRAGYSIGVGVRVPIYSGAENSHQVSQQQAVVEELKYDTESKMRDIRDQLVHSMEDVKAAQRKIDQEELQVKQANEAYKLAEVSFKAGSVTNLDLLDASTSLQDSQLELLKTNIDYLLAIYQLKWTVGIHLYE